MFGKLCYDFRATAEVVQGGTSFRDTLDELGIPKSTAYYWINAYEKSLGEHTPVSNYNKAGTRGFKDKPKLNLLIRKCRALAETPGGCSPVPVLVDEARAECTEPEEAVSVIYDMGRAITALAEHHKKFKEHLSADEQAQYSEMLNYDAEPTVEPVELREGMRLRYNGQMYLVNGVVEDNPDDVITLMVSKVEGIRGRLCD